MPRKALTHCLERFIVIRSIPNNYEVDDMAGLQLHQRLRASGASCMMNITCKWCYNGGERVAFFGVPVTGSLWGSKPADKKFKRAIWEAGKKHVLEAHNRVIVKNGVGGWKTIKAS